jgi:hypothetical protein
MKASMKRLRTAVAASGTSLVDIRGVGVVVAAMIIGHTGDVSTVRVRGALRELQRHRPDRGVVG